jgi:hypothetical protein
MPLISADARWRFRVPGFLACFFACCLVGGALAQSTDEQLALITALQSDEDWTLLQRTPLQFPVYHPQGMTRVGDDFFMSSVEVIEAPQRLADPGSGYDRSAGRGIGHLLKFNSQGELLAHTTLGDGAMYHPGGMDFDGEHLWIPVAEYRPDSHSIVYQVDPDTLVATEAMRFEDHLGAVLRNPYDQILYAASWGSRYLYQIKAIGSSYQTAKVSKVEKRSSDVDYQDCQLLGPDRLLCSGIGSMEIDNTHRLTIGGIELLNTSSPIVLHKIRVNGTSPGSDFLTRNPFYFEMTPQGRGLFYFVPEDDTAALYQYSTAAQ